MADCGQYFMAHDEAIKQNKRDIEIIYGAIEGLPQDVKHILDALKEIKEGMAEMDKKYVSKEVFELSLSKTKDEIKLWIYAAILSGLVSVVLAGFELVKLAVK